MKAPARSSASSSRASSIPERSSGDGRPLELFPLLAEHDHEQVSIAYEPTSGYRGIIAIHSTVLGPALGGTRLWNYRTDADALIDALRLARGMTYKAAVAGLNLGGGKSVLIGDHKTTRREPLFRAHGRHIESLNGRYITAEDVGTTTADMEYVKAETDHVTGLIGKSGDPSPVTAYGVYRGIKACARHRTGSDALAGKTVALQGCGSVGYHLAKLLAAEGARLVVADIDPERARRVVDECRAQAVPPDDIYGVRADVFAPCALGAVINDATLPRLQVEIVAGGARHHVRSRLRDQRRGPDQRERRARRVVAGAGAGQGGRDLRHHPPRVRDRAGGGDSRLPGGGPARRAAHRRGLERAAEPCLSGSSSGPTTPGSP